MPPKKPIALDGPVPVHPRQLELAPAVLAPPLLLDLIAPAPVARPADRNPPAVFLARLAPGSRPRMASSLRLLARLITGQPLDPTRVQWHLVRYQHAQALRAALAPRFAPSTVNVHLAALRGVLRECRRLGLMSSDDFGLAVDVECVRGDRLPAGREVTAGELRALFKACAVRSGVVGARDAALVALLYGCGIRRAEAADLELADYNAETGELKITGKRRRQRLVWVVAGGRAAIARWIEARGTAPGPLLHPIRKGGVIERRPLSSQSVFRRVQSIAKRAQVQACTPHDLRRSFVTHLLDEGADIVAVRDLAGHANTQTTARYDRRGERGKKKAAELLTIPFVDQDPSS
jgi:site-specific recombinase XerD